AFFIAKAIFFLQIEQYMNCLKYIMNIKTIQNTWLPTTASNFFTSNYEHYINCKQQFIVYLNKYKYIQKTASNFFCKNMSIFAFGVKNVLFCLHLFHEISPFYDLFIPIFSILFIVNLVT